MCWTLSSPEPLKKGAASTSVSPPWIFAACFASTVWNINMALTNEDAGGSNDVFMEAQSADKEDPWSVALLGIPHGHLSSYHPPLPSILSPPLLHPLFSSTAIPILHISKLSAMATSEASPGRRRRRRSGCGAEGTTSRETRKPQRPLLPAQWDCYLGNGRGLRRGRTKEMGRGGERGKQREREERDRGKEERETERERHRVWERERERHTERKTEREREGDKHRVGERERQRERGWVGWVNRVI